jgi:hypothetical protein
MGGLAFASILTLVAAPVFYLVIFGPEERRRLKAEAKAASTANVTATA